MNISIASDHAGFEQKQALVDYLAAQGHDVIDRGPDTDDRVDYPDYAELVARDVAGGAAERGVLVCGTGIGMAIAANKVHGIRCAVCNDPYSATMAHEHNDANVIAVGARVVGIEVLKSIFRNYLAARYNEKYNARLAMIAEIEREGK